MALICGQEFPWAVRLVANEHDVRLEALQETVDWLKGLDSLELDDAEKIWHILFSALWMTDKPLPQHDFCQRLADIINVMNEDAAKTFILGFVSRLAAQWNSFDKHRVEKFLVLIRKMVNSVTDWCLEHKQIDFLQDFYTRMVNVDKALGMKVQFVDVIADRLRDLVQLNTTTGKLFLNPFIDVFCLGLTQSSLVKRIHYLIISPLLETEGESMFGSDFESASKFIRGLSAKLNESVKLRNTNAEITALRFATCQQCREVVVNMTKKQNEAGQPAEKSASI